jgi:hypothetical protein
LTESEEIQPRPTPPPPPELNERWQLLMVPTGQLFADRRYQRGLVKNQVRKLVDNWDWEKYHPIIVSHRADGRYALLAGQQRTTAAIELGIPSLPAILQKQTDIRQEAKSYLGSGEIANIQAGDRFKARLIANEQKAFDIWNIVNQAGFTLHCMKEEEGTTHSDPFSISAVYSIETVFDVGYLGRALDIIMKAWGDRPTKDMVQSNMIRGVYMALRHIEQYEVSDDEIAKRFTSQEVKSVLDKGADRYRSMVVGRSMDAGVAAVLVDTFNYRRREQIPEFSKKAAASLRGRNAAKAVSTESRSKAGKASAAKNLRATEGKGKFIKRNSDE